MSLPHWFSVVKAAVVDGQQAATFKLNGNPGSSTYILGEIITDKLSLSGTPAINMQLNPNAAYSTLKATLLR